MGSLSGLRLLTVVVVTPDHEVVLLARGFMMKDVAMAAAAAVEVAVAVTEIGSTETGEEQLSQAAARNTES